MSSIRRGSHSSGSNPLAGIEDIDVQQVRNFIRESKSLGCSPDDTSAASAREVVSESFVDSLTKEEIDDIRNKLFSYWEKSAKVGEKPELEVDESKVAPHQGSDPKIQYEEAVTSFEDVKSEVDPTPEGLHDIGKIIETELRSIRETKLSESDLGKTEVGKMRRSENIDFTELKKKAADLPVTTGLASTRRKKQLPILRRTDPLEMVLRIYEYSDSDPAGTLQSEDAKGSIGVSDAPKMSKDQEFRRHLVIEMRFLYGRLVGAPKERAPSIIEETEGESSNSSVHTKDSIFSSRDPSMMDSPLGKSLTAYPEVTTDSAGPPQADDTLASVSQTLDSNSSSLSGLVNVPEFNLPDDAKKQSSGESAHSHSTTSSTTILSDDTLSGISSIPTDTSGARSSVSSLRDADALAGSLSGVPPQVQVEEATDDDAFLTLPLSTRDAGPSYLAVPQAPRLPSSLDDSSENAEAEDIANGRRQRERSPKEDENKAPKRQAL